MDFGREKMGELLLRSGAISEAQLRDALGKQQKQGGKLGDILVHNQVLTEGQIAQVLAEQRSLELVNLADFDVDRRAVVLLPLGMVRLRNVVPIAFREHKLILAMADPLDIEAIDEAEMRTGFEVEPVVATISEVRRAVDKYLVASDAMEALEQVESMAERSADDVAREAIEGDVPVVRIVNQLLKEAVHDGASDIHIEPSEHEVRVRYRVDGVLRDAGTLPKSSQAAVTSRIKLLGDMDISEHRRPLDGRIALRVDDMPVDIRVATYPTPYGEGLVLRVINSSVTFHTVDELGLTTENRTKIERMLARPYGALLVSGPTGSGKTTTLYALLRSLNTVERKIITIEDPIEYRMEGVSQIAVNARIGLTFAAGLRTILRSDPDVIMVGEIRDPETASIAVRAALTGHIVLSSVHTNDAPSAFTRLADLGVEPYITSSAVMGAVAQRLVRRLCPVCKRPASMDMAQLVAVGFTEQEATVARVHEAVGCPSCHGTGYKGRMGLYQVMEVNDELVRLHLANASAEELEEAALASGMRTMRRDGLVKVAAGLTSIDEVMRVVV